ncbi:MAG: pyrimidine 5'-nucleotidase [Myxococcales bacterium]|nr:pyrimidine 5'-nucleotidase [Myxococcales bacterium]
MSRERVTADVWIFDLDNTLYPRDCDLFAQIDVKMKAFVADLLGIDAANAYKVQKQYFRDYGSTLRGLMENHGLPPQEFLDFVHDIDVTPVPPNPALDDVLCKLNGRKIVFTNGTVAHATNVMTRLGITHHFEGIFDIHAAHYLPKPARSAYDKFLREYDVNPTRAVMLEDIARNLEPAHELGMTTVWIRSKYDHSAIGADGDHIHHIIDDLVPWLRKQVA